MRNLTTHDTRFRFGEPLGGRLGELPYIQIGDDEEIPPLGNVYLIYVDLWNSGEPVKSRVVIVWVVSGTEIVLKLFCQADDSRLKKQYQADPPFVQKILGILFLPEERDRQSKQYRRIETKATVFKEKIPELLRPFVTQVETWRTFFQQPAMQQLSGHHYVQVNQEGYYLAYISAGALRLGFKRPAGEEIESEGHWPEDFGLDFDPKAEPPTVVDNGIYWELPEPKILVILPHDSSNERVAAYYGYTESFREYMEAKKKCKQAMDAASRAIDVEDEEKRQRQVAAARQTLLS